MISTGLLDISCMDSKYNKSPFTSSVLNFENAIKTTLITSIFTETRVDLDLQKKNIIMFKKAIDNAILNK